MARQVLDVYLAVRSVNRVFFSVAQQDAGEAGCIFVVLLRGCKQGI